MKFHHLDEPRAILPAGAPMSDLGKDLFEIATAQARASAAAVQEGVKIGQRESEPLRKALQACVAAYVLAAKDENAKLPSYLMAALEGAKRAI